MNKMFNLSGSICRMLNEEIRYPVIIEVTWGRLTMMEQDEDKAYFRLVASEVFVFSFLKHGFL